MTQTSQKLPFMSIVMPSLNGEATVARAIESLIAQDYPKDRYEIICINDGSTDRTGEIMQSFKEVHYIHFEKNRGIPDARNAGLEAAQGDIYVSFDCDFVAAKDWLSQLAAGYQLPEVAGVGGYLVDLAPVHGLIQTYISISGQGLPTPPPVSLHLPLPAPFRRLFSYLTNGLHRFDKPAGNYSEVGELYGANCSFPLEILRGVGGWRKSMFWIEDRDLCLRIRQKYPDKKFYIMHDAKVMNNTEESATRYLLRPYKRGLVNFKFHKDNGIAPPLFPFPFLFVLGVLVSLFIGPFVTLLLILLLPQLLYFWWAYHAIRQRRLVYLVFPYLQLTEETMVIAGLVRGYIHYMRHSNAAA